MRKLASIQKIVEISPIPDADKIEHLKVLGWNLVARKGEFKVGDLCLYIEIDSMIPLIWLNDNAKPEDRHHLKTVKMKGQISQGLALPLTNFPQCHALPEGTDVSELLNVTKWEPPIDTVMAPNVKGTFPSFIPKTDEVRIQTIPNILQKWKDEYFYVTEKVDGSSLTFYKFEGVFGICSRNLELKFDENSFQWKLAKKYDLENRIPEGYAFQGEGLGPKIQSNKYKLTNYDIRFFNIYNIKTGSYLSFEDMTTMLASLNLPYVPLLDKHYRLPSTVEEIMAYCGGISLLSPQGNPIRREGVVIRALDSTLTDGEIGGRVSFKAVDPEFLLKNKE